MSVIFSLTFLLSFSPVPGCSQFSSFPNAEHVTTYTGVGIGSLGDCQAACLADGDLCDGFYVKRDGIQAGTPLECHAVVRGNLSAWSNNASYVFMDKNCRKLLFWVQGTGGQDPSSYNSSNINSLN